MAFEDVYLVTRRVKVALADEVGAAEQALGFTFPTGYREFVTKFGEGSYSNFVRVYLPTRIVNEYRDFQQRWDEYFFWDDGHDVIARPQVLESIIIADTYQGDELICHPSNPDRLLVLPRDSETVFEAGSGLVAAIEWLCGSGQLTGPIRFRYFESFDQRARINFTGPGKFEDVVEALKGLNLHDHIEVVTEQEDPFAELFIADFDGSIAMTADDVNVQTCITHDAESRSDKIDKVAACFESLGLVREQN